MKIDNKLIGFGNPTYIIADIGVNHNGDLNTALSMVEKAAECGVDAVKFQTFSTEKLILKGMKKAPYQSNTTPNSDDQYDMLKKLEIGLNFHIEIIRCCKINNITFFSTPYDEPSLKMLLDLKVPAIKVASTDGNNSIFINMIGKTHLPVILSTGMCTLGEIDLSINILIKNGCTDLAILKCTSEYPAAEHNVHLNGIKTLSNIYKLPIGFSDHTPGTDVSAYAVAAGAVIIEKHFTLDKTQKGPDHKASLSPKELKKLVKEVRRVEQLMGNFHLSISKEEQTNRIYLQKSLIARKNINAGDKFTMDNLSTKRTGGKGISASLSNHVIDKYCRSNLKNGDIINFGDLSDYK